VKKKSDTFSIIDTGLSIDGSIVCKGKLIVKGELKGTLEGSEVVVSEEGSICASTKVARITIGGSFDGDIRAIEELVVLATGNCSGKVVCKNLVVEPGGKLNAEVTCLAGEVEDIDSQIIK
jgi:cytoskeletal protein CcmA (bactofilin family)